MMTVKIEPLSLEGAYLFHPTEFKDDRGAFYVFYDVNDLKAHGVPMNLTDQCCMSMSKKGVVRGLHYQTGVNAQAKLVRCVKGEIWDVLVDLRKSSPTFGKWLGVTLSETNRKAVFIPRGFAHGFAALSDETCVFYQLDNTYALPSEGGVKYDDPQLAIPWPVQKPILSAKDLRWPLLKDAKLFD